MTSPELATRLDLTMTPDPCRVIIKLFVPGQDAALVHTRAAAVIERIAHLDEDESSRLLNQTMERFGTRHHDLEATFRHHYDLVRHRVAASSDLSPTARTLVGAYFSHEYAVEAAALCNPSMVAHPDQSALRPAQLRVAISLRQIGEGHISSIGFATGYSGQTPASPSLTGLDRYKPATAAVPSTVATYSPPQSPTRAATTKSPPRCSDTYPNTSTTTTSSGHWVASPPTCSPATPRTAPWSSCGG